MSEQPKVRPAMTKAEWAEALAMSTTVAIDMAGSDHAIAAIALHGQPFGFTREDVEILRWGADEPRERALRSIADRIEALLPPEGESHG